jgi:Kdo2-lipid IVA lauroyltransferase/acyltransferase
VLIDPFLIALIKSFQLLLRILPERYARAAGVTLGRMGYFLLPRRRKAAAENALRIQPSLSEQEARRIARKSFDGLGIMLVEVLLFPFLTRKEIRDRFLLEKKDGADDVIKSGVGFFALGLHYSNWEITGVVSLLLNRQCVALARPLKGHERLNRFVIGLREATGLKIIPNRETARDVMRLLREGQMVAFLGDQREKRSKAVWVELFGHTVPTSKGLVTLAMKTGAPVVPIYLKRRGFLRYTVVCDEPLAIERSGATRDELISRNARQVNALIERVVAEVPQDWFLVHRRFGRAG